ncbi:unnamed protein product [Thelazia callipaeda]|uniref:Peptidase S1 domain-containing protein n=1 Tax=Thelazia callipaeda TaxID=103827 RepID=A0A0N5DCF4_THECL|nr:unnamed protein product [Thelazia callipaeda]
MVLQLKQSVLNTVALGLIPFIDINFWNIKLHCDSFLLPLEYCDASHALVVLSSANSDLIEAVCHSDVSNEEGAELVDMGLRCVVFGAQSNKCFDGGSCILVSEYGSESALPCIAFTHQSWL